MPPLVRVKKLSKSDGKSLLDMYRSFQPLGAAAGLPPFDELSRRHWIDHVLGRAVNFGAFMHSRLVGHCILAPGSAGKAEIAYFVHQRFRRKGIGALLVQNAIRYAAENQIGKVWAVVGAANQPSVRLLRRYDFCVARTRYPDLEMERSVQVRQLAA